MSFFFLLIFIYFEGNGKSIVFQCERFEVLTALPVKNTVMQDVTPYSLVEGYQRLVVTFEPSKPCCVCIRQCVITPQETEYSALDSAHCVVRQSLECIMDAENILLEYNFFIFVGKKR